MEVLFLRSRINSVSHKSYYIFSSFLREVSWGLIIFLLWLSDFVPEDSGSKCNPSYTPSEEAIVSDVDEKALMEAESEPDAEWEPWLIGAGNPLLLCCP